MIKIVCSVENDEFVEVTLFKLESLTEDELRAIIPKELVSKAMESLGSLPEDAQALPEVKELAERLSSLYPIEEETPENEEKPTAQ
jgi:DNA primase large subunit